MEFSEKIGIDDDHMLLEDFMVAIADGFFWDNDGHGYLANETHYATDKVVYPSQLPDAAKGATHIVWCNK